MTDQLVLPEMPLSAREIYEQSITHGHLVLRAAKWLRNTRGCGVVRTEPQSFQREIPDAIGWNGPSRSTLVECKATRSDFLADGKKLFRKHPEKGMGRRRFYLTPPGLVRIEELPEFWGLLECHKTYLKIIQEARYMPSEMSDSIRRCEFQILYYAMWGVQNRGVTTLEGTGLRLPGS